MCYIHGMVCVRRRSAAFLPAILLALLPFAGARAGDPPPKITIGAALYPPFLERAPDGGIAGFERDLLRRFEAAEGVGISFRVIERFDDVLKALDKREIDMAGGGIHATADRMARYNFSPYLRSGLVVVGRPGAPSVAGERDLEARRIGVKRGATGEALARSLAEKGGGIRVVPYAGTEASYDALASGAVDVLVDDYLHARHLILAGRPVSILSKPMTSVGMGFAFRKDARSLALKARLDRFLRRFSRTKEFRSLYETYFF